LGEISVIEYDEPQPRARKGLSIRQAQLDSVGDIHLAKFEQSCLDFLREHFPQLAVMSSPAQELESVRSGIKSGILRGFSTEQDIVKYLYLRQLLGAGFDENNKNWVAAIINDQNTPPEERLDHAMDALADWLDGVKS
jgi:hypothetical protein